jgi:glycosyltransferase involved in cell wall biosynthesis
MVQAKSINPFFTIITCTRNSAKFIRSCLDSVASQKFHGFEHLIIDGHSTDGTLSILAKGSNSVIQAEPRGIANAMNIGINAAKGKYLYFLNSDDSLYDDEVLQKVHDYLVSHTELDWAFGNIHETDGIKTIGFPPKRAIFHGKHPSILKYYNYIPHQAAFIKKSVFDQFGLYDEDLKSMMDPEYWLRISQSTDWDYMPIVVANYLIRPDSQSENLAHTRSNTLEYEAVQSKYLSPLELVLAKFVNMIMR